MRTILLERPKGLPKAERKCVTRTVQPDVHLPYAQWVRHHRVMNKKCF